MLMLCVASSQRFDMRFGLQGLQYGCWRPMHMRVKQTDIA